MPRIIFDALCNESVFLAKYPVLNKSIKIIINYWLGPLLFIWFGYHIWQQISSDGDWKDSWNHIRSTAFSAHWQEWVLLCVLMLANWSIEALKWHNSIKHLQQMSYWRSFRAILTGLSFAVNTPNRIGEYLGRVLYVEEGNRIRAVAITIVNSWSQLIITLVMGVLALIYMQVQLGKATIEDAGLSIFWIRSFQWMLIVITVVLVSLYMRLGWLIPLLEKLPFIERFGKYFHVLGEFSRRELLEMLLLSLLRYFVFILQYQLVFSIFGVGLTWWQGFWMTGAVFLILAIVPTIALAELGLRGEVSLQLIGMLSKNKIGIVAATGSVWFVNLLIPAIVGSIMVIGIKIYRNK